VKVDCVYLYHTGSKLERPRTVRNHDTDDDRRSGSPAGIADDYLDTGSNTAVTGYDFTRFVATRDLRKVVAEFRGRSSGGCVGRVPGRRHCNGGVESWR